MAHFGIFDKNKNRFVYLYEYHRERAIPAYLAGCVQVEVGDNCPGAYSWNGTELVFDPDHIDTDEANRLRIHRIVHPRNDVLTTDFTLRGLKKTSPTYSRGRKTKAQYKDPANDDLIVEKVFTDVMDNGRLAVSSVTFNWYTEGGEIGLTKTDLVKTYNKAEAKTEQRKRRSRQIDYLEAGGEGTPIEPYMTAIIDRYDSEIAKYIRHDTSALEDTINAEADPTFVAYLNIEVPRVDDPNETISIKNSILYQITGVLP